MGWLASLTTGPHSSPGQSVIRNIQNLGLHILHTHRWYWLYKKNLSRNSIDCLFVSIESKSLEIFRMCGLLHYRQNIIKQMGHQFQCFSPDNKCWQSCRIANSVLCCRVAGGKWQYKWCWHLLAQATLRWDLWGAVGGQGVPGGAPKPNQNRKSIRNQT